MPDLPTGTVTFLYTDLEGSTVLWEEHPQAMRTAVVRHDALLRAAILAHDGQVFRTVGDGLCAAFATAPAAVAAALDAQRSLVAETWGEIGPMRARMALHTGAVELVDGDYVGACLNRIARLLAAGYGGQVLLSAAVQELTSDSLPRGAGLRDAGEHRLRNLTRSEHAYQLLHPDLPADFPPLRSLDAYPHNLPRQLTLFIGREREVAEVSRLLAATPLLTLTGTGGCGKTRLALQIAAEVLEDYPDGVWLIELAALTDPDQVPQAVAMVLGVREQPGQSILTTLLAWLRTRRLLLVLDNCEHLLDAGARLADAVIRSAPGVRVLATSREALGITGEVSWRVPSLPVPSPGLSLATDPAGLAAVRQYEAVRLFVDRAVAVHPGFTVTHRNMAAVSQVCARLDGIPLAIELAATRVSGLAVEQIAARLDQRFRLLTGGSRTALPRQQTLAAAIGWSYQLLSAPERAVFNRLAVFSGRFTLEAAEAVCAGDGLASADILDLLLRLVDKSLVLADEGQDGREWYRLLETLRQYGREQLLASEQVEAVQERHAVYYLALAEQAAPELTRSGEDTWRARLEADLANLRAALRWAVEAGDAERGLRVTGQLFNYWYYRGYPADTRAWLVDLLAQPAAVASTAGRGWALFAAALIAFHLADPDAARRWCDEAAALHRAASDTAGLALTQGLLGRVTTDTGDVDAAWAQLEEAVALAHTSGDWIAIVLANTYLAIAAYAKRDYAHCRTLMGRTVAMARDAGYKSALVGGLTWQGFAATAQGDYAAARQLCTESLTLRQEDGVSYGLALTLSGFANLAAAQGQPVRALRLVGVADHLREAEGIPATRLRQAGIGRRLDACREQIGADAADSAWAAGHAMTLDEAIAYALAEEATDA